MPLRTFISSDGTPWTAWDVRADGAGALPGAPTEWLAFQNADESERRRLTAPPPRWEEMSDDRLDLLRRMAHPAPLLSRRHSPPSGVAAVDDARSRSGPDHRNG
jgi:hypothetical protein